MRRSGVLAMVSRLLGSRLVLAMVSRLLGFRLVIVVPRLVRRLVRAHVGVSRLGCRLGLGGLDQLDC